MSTHDEAYEALESYVFGTLDHDEAEAVEEHLNTGCETCLAQVRELGELSVRLAAAYPRRQPPPHVGEGLTRRIGAAPPGRRSQRMSWTAAASLAAFVVVVTWAIVLQMTVSSLRRDLEESQLQVTRLSQDQTAFRMAANLLGKPCTKVVDLAGVDPNPEAAARLLLHPDEQVAVIYVYRMPPTASGMAYQLWFVRDGKPASVGVFGVGEDGSAIMTLQGLPDPKSIAEFRVTIEPADGTTQPTGMLYLKGANILH